MKFLARLIICMGPIPPLLPPPSMPSAMLSIPPPLELLPPDWVINFMTVIAAPLIASCLVPDAAPPDWSKSLPASDIAIAMRADWPPPPLDPPEAPPEVKCLRACMAAALPMELALIFEALPWPYAC